MKEGCVKNFLATVGCLTLFVVVVGGGWLFRDQLLGAYRSVTGTEPRAAADSTVGVPSGSALRSAEAKEASLGARGTGYVQLSADEVASLIDARLAPPARAAVDSLRVVLTEGRIALEARVRLAVFGKDLLGPLAGLLDASERLRMAGGAEVRAPGEMAWRCDEFVIVSFPFPPSVIPALVNKLTGRDDGVFLIPVPRTVGEVRVRADGVTLYRRVE